MLLKIERFIQDTIHATSVQRTSCIPQGVYTHITEYIHVNEEMYKSAPVLPGYRHCKSIKFNPVIQVSAGSVGTDLGLDLPFFGDGVAGPELLALGEE